MKTLHCTTDQLNALVDGRLEPLRVEEIQRHLEQCDACTRALHVIQGLDRSLRALPLERVPEDFAENVLKNLRLVRGSSWLFRILSNAGYLFGLALVLGAMFAAFVVTGVVETDQLRQQGEAAGIAVLRVREAASGWLDAFSRFLVQYVPFAFASGSARTIVMIVVVLMVLVGFDRLLARRLPHHLQ